MFNRSNTAAILRRVAHCSPKISHFHEHTKLANVLWCSAVRRASRNIQQSPAQTSTPPERPCVKGGQRSSSTRPLLRRGSSLHPSFLGTLTLLLRKRRQCSSSIRPLLRRRGSLHHPTFSRIPTLPLPLYVKRDKMDHQSVPFYAEAVTQRRLTQGGTYTKGVYAERVYAEGRAHRHAVHQHNPAAAPNSTRSTPGNRQSVDIFRILS